MSSLDKFLYNTFALPLIYGGLKVASPLHPKIRRGFRERKEVWTKLSEVNSLIDEDRKPRFWIHSSSAGEFLQSIPVLEEIKKNWPNCVIIFTYFSPSADAIVKSSRLVDIPSYLPADSQGNVKKIFSILKPDILLFSRYDVWPNLVWEAGFRTCPTVLINATLSEESLRMKKWIRKFYGRLCSDLELICTASEADRDKYLSIGVPAWKVEVTGDTKYDETYRRVLELSRESNSLEPFLVGKRVILGGSTWPVDEKHLLSAYSRIKKIYPDAVLLLVPHEPTPGHVNNLIKRSSAAGCIPVTYSSLKEQSQHDLWDVMIVDRIGLLAGLYTLAYIVLVGGGFSRGVHNILEPASLGLPVLMGPNYRKAPEAVALARHGGAKIVTSDGEVEKVLLDLLNDREAHKSMSELALKSVHDNLDATGRTLEVLQSSFPALFPSIKDQSL
jgi:3-deoxy-D-manno-octulosonic-acid transferase